ncbi:class I SAM-dependent methyltransferase [Polymorphospora rubra]|uniref:class I SAM-dependent methyltransferase n=1 Tax=Polymorphospora rubra TaxID=338584 RepID=UPI0033F988DF
MKRQTTPIVQTAPAHRAERTQFLREAIRNPRSIGAVLPSSKTLAKALASAIPVAATQPLNVLEVGAGTGAVTRHLIENLPRGSRLDIIEANPAFTECLRRITTSNHNPASLTAEVHPTLLEEFKTHRRYDVIISGLPMTNFEPGAAREIMARLMSLLHPGGALTYFAYCGTRIGRRVFSSATEYRRHLAVDTVMKEYRDAYSAKRQTVWSNIPPAHVWNLARPLRSNRCARRRDHPASPTKTARQDGMLTGQDSNS